MSRKKFEGIDSITISTHFPGEGRREVTVDPQDFHDLADWIKWAKPNPWLARALGLHEGATKEDKIRLRLARTFRKRYSLSVKKAVEVASQTNLKESADEFGPDENR